MTLNERITADMKAAMKSGDQLRLETLRTLRAHLIELTKRGDEKPLTPDDELAVLSAAVKKRKEAIDLYRQGRREELARKEEEELRIINEYLPKQLSAEEAAEIVAAVIKQVQASSANDFGRVMSAAMKELKGKINGKTVQELVKTQLSG